MEENLLVANSGLDFQTEKELQTHSQAAHMKKDLLIANKTFQLILIFTLLRNYYYDVKPFLCNSTYIYLYC